MKTEGCPLFLFPRFESEGYFLPILDKNNVIEIILDSGVNSVLIMYISNILESSNDLCYQVVRSELKKKKFFSLEENRAIRKSKKTRSPSVTVSSKCPFLLIIDVCKKKRLGDCWGFLPNIITLSIFRNFGDAFASIYVTFPSSMKVKSFNIIPTSTRLESFSKPEPSFNSLTPAAEGTLGVNQEIKSGFWSKDRDGSTVDKMTGP